MRFGLVSFGAALGEPVPVERVVSEYTEFTARVLAYGYRNVLRCRPDVGLTDLAIEAASKALAVAGTDPAELDLVVLAVTDLTEYLYWDAAASVAYRLGATRAEAVLLSQACAGGALCLDTVAGKLATHPGYEMALVIAASRCCEHYWNRMESQPLVFSDGAAAAVARRGHPRLRWLATEVVTDGRYADFYRLDAGGAAAPFDGSATAGVSQVRDMWDVMRFFQYDAEGIQRFMTEMDERAKLTVERACARASVTEADLAKVILISDNVAAMRSLIATLGIAPARTNLDLALDYGHLGAADYLFCLGQYNMREELAAGDLIALVSRGRGMHWACTLLEA
jgi:3-oxoacyl-[acyl-carrier-protein] synthase III